MPKIIAHKVWNLQLDKGAYAKTAKIVVKSLYPDKTKDEQEKLNIKNAIEMIKPYLAGSGKCLFGEWFFALTPYEEALDKEKLKLLLLEAIDKEREKFERLKRKFFYKKGERGDIKREPIPEDAVLRGAEYDYISSRGGIRRR